MVLSKNKNKTSSHYRIKENIFRPSPGPLPSHFCGNSFIYSAADLVVFPFILIKARPEVEIDFN
jgi:hypothetical protein